MLQLGLSSSAQAGSCLPLPKSPTLPKLLSLPDLSYIAPGTFCFSLTRVIPVPQWILPCLYSHSSWCLECPGSLINVKVTGEMSMAGPGAHQGIQMQKVLVLGL